MKQLSIMEYLNVVRPINPKTGNVYTRQGILWILSKGRSLPNVIKSEKVGHSYVLAIHQ